MEIMKIERKGKHLNTLERYHVYKISKEGIHMNDMHDETHNPTTQGNKQYRHQAAAAAAAAAAARASHTHARARAHYKTWSHTTEGAPKRQDSKFQKTTFIQKVISGHKSQNGLDTLT
jgi:hypothetical protein